MEKGLGIFTKLDQVFHFSSQVSNVIKVIDANIKYIVSHVSILIYDSFSLQKKKITTEIEN